MLEKEILVDVVALIGGGGCGCVGGCGPAAADDGSKSETERVVELNATVRKQRKDVRIRLFNYKQQGPPSGLQKLIDDLSLELPAVFVEGKPAFQGRIPTVEDLLEAIAKLTQ